MSKILNRTLNREGQKNQNKQRFNFKSRGFIWTSVGVALLIILTLAYLNFRPSIAKGLIERGDNLLSESKYIKALVQYKKADYLINNEEIDQKIILTDQAQKDISKLEMIWREKNNILAQESLKKARGVYDSEYDSVVLSKEFIESEQPQFAIIAAKTAIEMEQNYTDAWLYLGIAHLESVNKLELSQDNYNYHREEAKSALDHAQTLSPDNENVKKYLEGL